MRTSGTINNTNTGVYTPEKYGAVGDGSTVDTAAFQAMYQDMPTNYGYVELADKAYKVPGLVIPKKVTHYGKGAAALGGEYPATRLITTATTGNMINVQAHGVKFQDIAFEGPLTGTTAGSLLRFTTAEGIAARGFNVTDCSFHGGWVQLDCHDNWGFIVRGTLFREAKNNSVQVACVSIPDAGDSTINECLFVPNASGAASAIYQTNSGGLRVINNKFNGAGAGKFQYHYLGDGMVGTSILMLGLNSFENYARSAIRVVANQEFDNIIISGNELSAYQNNGFADIELQDINLINISGGTIDGYGNTSPIHLINCSNVDISTTRKGYGVNYTQTGSSDIRDARTLTYSAT